MRVNLESLSANIITVGDELLIGQVVDSNAAYIASELTKIGVIVSYSLTIHDHLTTIATAIDRSLNQCPLTIVTGGLGPTPDDLTRESTASLLGVSLKTDSEVLAAIHNRFAILGREVPRGSERVAQVPEGFETLSNSLGTAPGLWHQRQDGNIVVLLPGVPHEMKAIFSTHVIPRITHLQGREMIAQRTLKVAGIGETIIQHRMEAIAHVIGHDLMIAYLPGLYGVRVRLTVRGDNANKRLNDAENFIRKELGATIFGSDEDTLESVLGELLKYQGKTIAVAESCTGGLVLNHLTNVPGASDYVLGGVIAYSNRIKQHQLGVDENTLKQHGAVSELVALQMAEGIRNRFCSDVGLSVTGISGPTGGSDIKPVGLVWIGYADAEGAFAVKRQFGDDRSLNKQRSALAVLDLGRKTLLKRSNQ
ncbi:MAG: competence/damage-inducible protein A [Bacteroidetes bacterium]|nr:competence/damage-inducible protein A [Bacteroidota bacterium]